MTGQNGVSTKVGLKGTLRVESYSRRLMNLDP